MKTLTNSVKIFHGETLHYNSAKVRFLHFINITLTFQEFHPAKVFRDAQTIILTPNKRKCLVFSPSLRVATSCKNIHLIS